MPKLRAHKVVVIRDETTRISKEVWEWELPCLEAKHPEGFVIVSDDVIEVERDEVPDAGDEFARLTKAYGTDDNNRELTELLFGYRQAGVLALGKLIDASVVGNKYQAPKKPQAAKGKGKGKQEAAKPVQPPEDVLGND